MEEILEVIAVREILKASRTGYPKFFGQNGARRTIKGLVFVAAMLMLLLSCSFAQEPTYPECYEEYYSDPQGESDCVSSDVKTSYVYIADYNGDPIESCGSNEIVDVYIWFGFETTPTRYWVHVVYDVYAVNETDTTDLGRHWTCVDIVENGGPDVRLNDVPYHIYCGDTVVLENIIISWTQDHTLDCTTDPFCGSDDLGNPKCNREGTISAYPEPPGTISGFKWNDLDRDGVWEDGEPPLEGWTITCKNKATEETSTRTTDENGKYSFDDLDLGTYQLYETVESGWAQTSSPVIHEVTLSTTARFASNINFGNAMCQEVFAGDDQIVCAGDEVTLEGDANYYDLVGWSSDLCGDYLDYPISGESELIARFYPPATGLPDGFCIFTLCAEGACDESCDDVTVYVVDLPDAEIRDMGDS